jgi:uncharacterized membrane protein (UPF0127 family)
MRRFQAFNRDKQVPLASELELAGSSWVRMKGLLGRNAGDFTDGKGLWIVPSQGVHTIGMSFPIDVLYLDSGSRVIHLRHRMGPFRIGALKLKARSVIELPAGTLARTRTSIGDVVEISEVNA